VAKVLQIFERLMDESSELLKAWSTPELISAIYDASSIARYIYRWCTITRRFLKTTKWTFSQEK